MIFNPANPTEFIINVQHPESTGVEEGMGDSTWLIDLKDVVAPLCSVEGDEEDGRHQDKHNEDKHGHHDDNHNKAKTCSNSDDTNFVKKLIKAGN
jgi:hypothetical protein